LTARGHLVTHSGVVLAARRHREADRIAVLFTEELGKVPVRFIGVERPKGKLKALAEPMAWAEHRLHIREGAEFCIGTGGALVSVFPAARGSLGALWRGLEVCGMLDKLTPQWKPAPDKFTLVTACLSAMDAAARARCPEDSFRWLAGAFALRLFESAGFGLRERPVTRRNRELWERLHAAPWEEVAAIEDDGERLAKLEALTARTVERLTERPAPAAPSGAGDFTRATASISEVNA